jgi:FkbM family methyltransferase
MKFLYGANNTFIDITPIVLSKCIKSDVAYLPTNDSVRASFFTDPLLNVLKVIKIVKDDTEIIIDHETRAFIDMSTQEIYMEQIPDYIRYLYPQEYLDQSYKYLKKTLQQIHQRVQLKHGSLHDELPEQYMAVRYLTGNEKVLEIGANVGRNTVVIQSILNTKNNTQFVTLECDPKSGALLKENRDLNRMSFQIENSALSKRKLIQKGWDTIVSDVVLDGYFAVQTITWEELRNKYNIEFDTLVLDCEGAFYYILQDMPEMLQNINMILMENDYYDITHKEYVDSILKQNHFTCVYQEAGGWGVCYSRFFETWKKI